MFNTLILWVLDHPKRFIFFIILLSIFAGSFVYKNISINTSNTDLLSKELTFRKNDIAFTKEFPQFSNNIMVVIDAKERDVVKDIASKFYKEVKIKGDKFFNDIFYPEELDFFKQNGLLYLSENELEKNLDEIANYQPFISRLSEDQTLYNLLNTINFFFLADLNDQYLENINKLFKKLTEVGNANNSLSWSNLFSSGSETNYREIIYLQPKLNTNSFFPSKDSLVFLENSLGELSRNYKHSNYSNIYSDKSKNFNIRLTGVVPMEQEELNTLEEDSKKGIFISLLFVLIIVSIAFFWRIHLIVGSLITLIIGLVWTTAIALLFFEELNLISIAFAVLFIGLGIDFAIHYCLRSIEFFDETTEKFLINVHNSISKALFLTAIAIAIGFFSFTFTSFKGIAQLGAIAGSGMFVSLFLTLFFLPAFLILKKDKKEVFSGWTDFERIKLYSFFNKNSKVFIYLSVALILGSLSNLRNIQFENDPLKLRDQSTISVQTMNQLIKDKSINPHSVDILVSNFSEVDEIKSKIVDSNEIKEAISFFDLIPRKQEEKLEILNQFKTFYPEIKLKEPRLLTSKEFELEKIKINDLLVDLEFEILKNYKNKIDIKNIEKLKERINSYKDFSSFTDYEKQFFYFLNENIKRYNNSLEANIISEEGIPNSLKTRYIGKNGKIRVEIVPQQDLDNYYNKKNFIEKVSRISRNVSGGSFTTYEAGKEITKSFKEAMSASIILTILFLIFTLKNFKKVFIVFINLVAAFLFTLLFLDVLGLNLNFANIISLPLLFGLGAATSIQTVLRTQEFNNLENYFKKSSTPSAVFFSLLTTLGAFFVLSLSSHVGTASMGKLLIISLFSIFLANLTILIPLEKYFFKK